LTIDLKNDNKLEKSTKKVLQIEKKVYNIYILIITNQKNYENYKNYKLRNT